MGHVMGQRTPTEGRVNQEREGLTVVPLPIFLLIVYDMYNVYIYSMTYHMQRKNSFFCINF